MRNHAIDILENELEELLKAKANTKNMSSLIQEDIDDIELAISNLKMLDSI